MNLTETNIRLIQASLMHTGSTLLSNLLKGLFEYETKIEFCTFSFNNKKEIKRSFLKSFVLKTHAEHIPPAINNACGNAYKYWIISSNRDNKIYRCNHPNFISFEYEQLLETTTNSIETIVNTVAQKLKTALPTIITDEMDINASIQRIKTMNTLYEKIKNQPFKFTDWPNLNSKEVRRLRSMAMFYEIHGHHRNRK